MIQLQVREKNCYKFYDNLLESFEGGSTAPTTLTEMSVISAADMVEQCKVPIAITNVLTMGVMGVINMLGMFSMFTKLEKMHNPARIAAKIREKRFRNRVNP